MIFSMEQLKPFFIWLQLHPYWASIAVFTISLAESLAVIGLLIPGSVMMTAIGGLIGAGILPVSITMLWAMGGAVVGDNLSYWLGYHYHDHIRQLWPFRRYPKLLENAITFFKQHGGKSVFIGRFVGPVRPMIPVIAGMMNMPPLRFMLANIGSAIAWAPAYMLPGILLGAASAELAPKTATRILFIVVICLLLLWCISWLLKRLFKTFLRGIDSSLAYIWQALGNSSKLQPVYRFLQYPRHDHSQLTIVTAFLICLILYISLAFSAYHKGLLTYFDNPVFHLLRSIHTPAITQVLIPVTFLGQGSVIFIMLTAVSLWLTYKRQWLTLIHWLAVGILSISIIEPCKRLLQIARPGDLIHNPTNWSFPSGHAGLSAAVFSFLAFLIAANLKPCWRRLPYLVTSILIIGIALSRIYLSAHWLSDILGGLLLGLACCLLVVFSYRRYTAANHNPTYLLSPIQLLTVTLISLLAAWSTYAIQHYHQAVYSYTPYAPQKILDADSWWQQGDRQISLYRHSRIGKPVQILNVQWAGDLNAIEDELELQGWQSLPKPNLIHMINRLVDNQHTPPLPLLSQFYEDKKPLIVMAKTLPNEKALLILRLWDDQTMLNNRMPLWVGTVSYYRPWKFSWHPARQIVTNKCLPPALPMLEKDLPRFAWKEIPYTQAERLATRDNIDWQGRILLIKPK